MGRHSIRAERVKRSVKRSLKLVPKEELEKVVEEVVSETDEALEVIPEGAKPGDVVNGFKVAWTYDQMLKNFPIVTFTPEETVPLTWNGVKVQALAMVEMHVPEPFKEIYDRHRREINKRLTLNNREGLITEIGIGLGALEPPKQ